METQKYRVDVYLSLDPPGVTEDMGKHRVTLLRTIHLGFVPVPSLCLRFERSYPKRKVDHWSPLLKASSGPRGAVGLGFNPEIWPISAAYYSIKRELFQVRCSPEMLTLEQLNAVEELMRCYHKFRSPY